MYLKSILILSGILFPVLFMSFAGADVSIPENELTSYYDSDGIFTVVGAIKNSESNIVIPTITINIFDGKKTTSESFTLSKVYPTHTLPFKLKFPEIHNTNATLLEPNLTFEKTSDGKSPTIEVIYDNTLVMHDDGHQSGRIINTGSETLSNIKIYALIHDKKFRVLDMGQSTQIIDNIKPGEIREFTIYPDPSLSQNVAHYSCFDIGSDTVIPINTQRKDKPYNFRYDSVVWFAYAKFNDAGDTLTMKTQNSWPLENYANFEFPRLSNDEKFNILFNNEPIDFIQSIDETGNWHVAFLLAPHTSGEITITGFKDGKITSHQDPNNLITQTENQSIYYSLIIIPIGIAAAILGIKIGKNRSKK